MLLYSVTEVFILPKIHQPSFFRAMLDLALPFMVAYLLLFYIIFGEWLVVLAEAVPDRPTQNASAMALRSCLGKSGVVSLPGVHSPSAPQFCRQTILRRLGKRSRTFVDRLNGHTDRILTVRNGLLD